jgi:peptidoglycan/LPS O-acetylase OafA/YrhL
VVQGEYFETGHLWFIVLLLTFSLMLAPAVRWVPHARTARWRDRLAVAARRPGAVLLPALPLALICAFVGLEEGFAAWSRWAYLLFFLYGFVLASDERFGAALRRHARAAAVLGAVAFAAGLPGFLRAGGDPFTGTGVLQVTSRALYGLAGWCCLVAILGLLDRPRPGPPAGGVPDPGPGGVYAYLATAALPFYVLHQPIVVAVAYAIVPWHEPIIVEYAVIVAVSLALTLAAYEFLVRRTRLTRFLFGMRPSPRSGVPLSGRREDPRTTR